MPTSPSVYLSRVLYPFMVNIIDFVLYLRCATVGIASLSDPRNGRTTHGASRSGPSATCHQSRANSTRNSRRAISECSVISMHQLGIARGVRHISSRVLGTHSVSNDLQLSEPWLAALDATDRGECLGAVWHSRALRSARHTVSRFADADT